MDRDKRFFFFGKRSNREETEKIIILMFTCRAMYVYFSKLHRWTINLNLPAEVNLSALCYFAPFLSCSVLFHIKK